MPPPRAWSDKNPEADKRLKNARAAVIARAEELDIPVENVLTPELLRRVSWSPPVTLDLDSIRRALAELGAREWQLDATAEPILDAFVAAGIDVAAGAADEVDFVEGNQTIETAPDAAS